MSLSPVGGVLFAVLLGLWGRGVAGASPRVARRGPALPGELAKVKRTVLPIGKGRSLVVNLYRPKPEKVSRIEVRINAQGRPVQVLVGDKGGPEVCVPRLLPLDLRVVDANFDGYQDLQLLQWQGASSWGATYWIYQPTQKRFVKNRVLSGLSNPSFDAKRRRVISHNSDGAVLKDSSTYRWRRGRLVLVERFSQNGRAFLLWRRVRGRLKVVAHQKVPRCRSDVETRWHTVPGWGHDLPSCL
ncbi:MAG: hypothetical protein KAI47_26610 [Deltaproteobacteria bacterium]|nr:hypothetical protein [Deltaproteobacteria bacterium]